MAPASVTRKLTTIMAADAVGYSELMAADEEATLAALRECRATLDGLVAQHGGRIFNTAGDSVLAEFASAVEAVRCAIAIQEDLRVRNAELPEDSQMWLRIGINVGDVMVEDGNLYGDGVNVAARLEGLAEKGGICISGSTFEQVKNKLTIAFRDIGAQTVKNIPHPVPAFQLVPGEVAVEGRARWTAPRAGGLFASPRARLGLAVAGAAVAAAVVAVFWTGSPLGRGPASAFDGQWEATLSSLSGCRDNEPRSFPFRIAGGMIDEPHHRLPKTGTVSPDGRFTIEVSDAEGNYRATQTGTIVGNAGEGRLQGRRPSCTGTVTLVRVEE